MKRFGFIKEPVWILSIVFYVVWFMGTLVIIAQPSTWAVVLWISILLLWIVMFQVFARIDGE